MEKEFQEMDKLIGALLGTRNASLKEPVAQAYARREPYDPNVLERLDALRSVLASMVLPERPQLAEADMAFYNVAFFDAYRSARLPANLTQAQRDYFGAHTYRRLDKPGSFHTKWEDMDVAPEG